MNFVAMGRTPIDNSSKVFMLEHERTQSLAEFSRNPQEILDRLRRTCWPEVLTMDGKACAVLIAPEVYKEWIDEIVRAQDLVSIRKSVQQLKEGEGIELHEAFAEIHARLLTKQAAESVTTCK
jgi:hypothetical protein